MSFQPDSGISPRQFAEQHRPDLQRLHPRFSVYSGEARLSQDDLREYLQEPLAALPPRVLEELPDIELFLVPYLERLAGRTATHRVAAEKPQDRRAEPSARWDSGDHAVLMIAVNHAGGVAEYHYRFYQLISSLLAERLQDDIRLAYYKLLREELNQRVYGEVDEASWRIKQSLVRRARRFTGESKAFVEYARQSFEDSMTLYLHGICCDIDVEAGPQQLPSRYVRRRLELVRSFYPLPEGYALFPEEPKTRPEN